MLYPLEFATLVKLVIGIVVGWYGRELFMGFQAWLRKRAEARKLALLADQDARIEALYVRILDLEDDITKRFAALSRDIRKGKRLGTSEAWNVLRGIRNAMNEHSGCWGQANRLLGHDILPILGARRVKRESAKRLKKRSSKNAPN